MKHLTIIALVICMMASCKKEEVKQEPTSTVGSITFAVTWNVLTSNGTKHICARAFYSKSSADVTSGKWIEISGLMEDSPCEIRFDSITPGTYYYKVFTAPDIFYNPGHSWKPIERYGSFTIEAGKENKVEMFLN